MNQATIMAAGKTAALDHACQLLTDTGITVTTTPLSHVTHLLLPVPSFEPDGAIKGGGSLAEILSQLPRDITVIGGKLSRSELENYQTLDLLEYEPYLLENAHITAHCALGLAISNAPYILDSQPVLVIGWGRIGQKLAQLLQAIGAKVTVAARKETDRIALVSRGYHGISIQQIQPEQYKLIFNTAPAMLLPECSGNGIKIDLASQLGIGGKNVIWARGLPNKLAPVSSGQLIAKIVISHLNEEATA